MSKKTYYRKEIDSYGYTYFFNRRGQFHRTDGPAFIAGDGYKAWYKNGKRHRDDGPAVEYGNGDKVYWIEGKMIRKESINDSTFKELKIGDFFKLESVKLFFKEGEVYRKLEGNVSYNSIEYFTGYLLKISDCTKVIKCDVKIIVS